MMSRFIGAGAALVAMLTSAHFAGAAEPTSDVVRHESKVFGGVDFGLFAPSSLTINGKRAANEAGNPYAGFHVGYSHALSQRFGVLGLTRFGTWNTEWADTRDEQRYRIDMALGPEIHGGDKTGGWHLSAPIGATLAQSQGRMGRAVQDSYGPGRGMNFGLVAGLDVGGFPAGAYFDVSWIAHITWIDHAARFAGSDVVVHDSYRYVDSVFLLTVGYLYRL